MTESVRWGGHTTREMPCLNPRHTLRWRTTREMRAMRLSGTSRRRRWSVDELWATTSSPRAVLAMVLLLELIVAAVPALGIHGIEPPRGLPAMLAGVQAALLGFAVAVAVFGFQLGRDAWRGRSIAIAPRLEASVFVGLALLGVTSLVAVAAPGPPLETAEAVLLLAVTAAWFCVLALAFVEVKRLTGLRTHLSIRRGRVLRAIATSVQGTIEQRVSLRVLAAEAERVGATAPALIFTPLDARQAVVHAAAGTVHDVRLCTLRAGLAHARSAGPVQVSTALGRVVTESTTLAEVAVEAPAASRRMLTAAVSLAKGDPHAGLADELRALAGYATDHVEDNDVVQAVVDGFIEALEAYAREWAAYTRPLSADMLPSFFEGARSPTEQVTTHVLRLAKLALRGGHEESLSILTYFGARLIRTAAAEDAPAFVTTARQFSRGLVQVSLTPGAPAHTAAATRKRAWLGLIESLTYYLGNTAGRGTQLEPIRHEVRGALVETLHELLVAGDFENFEEGLRRWRAAEEDDADDWAEPRAPRPWGVSPVLAAEVVRLTNLGRLQEPRRWLAAILGRADSREIVAAFSAELESPDRFGDLASWELEDLPTDEGHMLGATSNLLRAMLWLLLMADPKSFRIPRVLYLMRDQLLNQASELTARPAELGGLLGIPDPDERSTRLTELIHEGIAEARAAEERALRAAPLSRKVLDGLAAAINERRAREFPRALVASKGTVHVEPEPPFGPLLPANSWMPKIFLLEADDVASDAARVARFLVQDLGRRELGRLVLALRRVAEVIEVAAPQGERIAAALEAMRARGRPANAVFVGLGGELWQDPHFDSMAGDERGAAGRFEDVDVFFIPDRSFHDVYAVDLAGVRQTIDLLDGDFVRVQAADATPEATAARFAGGTSTSTTDVYAILSLEESFRFEVDPVAAVRVTDPSGATTQEAAE